MTRYKFLQLKDVVAAAGILALVLVAIFELGRAILSGVIDAPIGPLHNFILVGRHDHPFWFWFSVFMNVGGAVLCTILVIVAVWSKRTEARNINKKYPMTNRWTGRF